MEKHKLSEVTLALSVNDYRVPVKYFRRLNKCGLTNVLKVARIPSCVVYFV